MTKSLKALLAAGLFAFGIAGASLPAQASGGLCYVVGEQNGQPVYFVEPFGGDVYISTECPPGFTIIG